MKNRFLLIIGFILLGIKTSLHAQVLSAGAVAFIGYQGDAPMAFSLVTTDTIPPNTQISFTDNKWTGAHLLENEQTVIWTSPDTALPVGTIFRLQDNGNSMTVSGPGTATGRIWYSLGQGEQILAYLGSAAQPSFIAGVSNNTWRPTCDSIPYFEFRTCLPAPLVNGQTAIAFMQVTTINIDNGYLSITPLNVTGPDMLPIIYNINYWFLDNAEAGGVSSWPTWNSGGNVQPFVSTIEFTQSSTSVMEGGSLATITLDISTPLFSPQTVVLDIFEFPGITASDYSTNPAVQNGKITLNIPANATSASFTFQAQTDGIAEANETVSFAIESLSGGLTAGNQDVIAVTLLSTDQNFSRINFLNDTLEISEGQTSFLVPMSINPSPSSASIIVLNPLNGAGIFNDYYTSPALSSGQLLLFTETGNPNLSFTISAFDDFQIEPDEYLTFTVVQVSNGLQIGDSSTVVIKIKDNDNIPTFVPPLLFLNELNAFNNNYPDANGQLDDWIELYNADTQTVNISGYYITDMISNPTKFQFPQISAQTTMEPGTYKILWADQNTVQGPLHLNFTLNGTGGFVGIFAPDGETLIDAIQYPGMTAGLTFGRFEDGTDNWIRMYVATPGATNTDSVPAPNFISGFENNQGISLYPNPVTNRLNILKSGNEFQGISSIEIYDLQGRRIPLVFTELVHGKHWMLNTEHLDNGAYLVLTRHSHGISTARFVK
jgi:hypothetical protein